MGHKFRFFRAGGVDQVQLTTGADLLALGDLDQKLWVALACPVTGLELDQRTLALIDSDADGRVRAPELLAAIEWCGKVLTDVEELARPSEELPLAVISQETDEGKLIRATAEALLDGLGKSKAESIAVADTKTARDAFDKQRNNGDGILTPSQLASIADGGELYAKVAEAVLAGVAEPKEDRSKEKGVDQANVEAFFAAARAHVEHVSTGKGAELLPLGEDTAAAAAALLAVRGKIDDFFARRRIVEFDERSLAAMNRDEAGYLTLSPQLLGASPEELRSYPLSQVHKGARLPLKAGVNPAWAAEVEAFRACAIVPLLGERDALDAADYAKLTEKLAAYLTWNDTRPASPWTATFEELGSSTLGEWFEGGVEKRLVDLLVEDAAAIERAGAVEAVEKLAHFRRDLLKLANNFVSFRDFYRPGAHAAFQVGTLYIDQRALDLVLRVSDPARHVALGPLSSTYLLYCDVKRQGSTMQVVAAVTNGDVDNLTAGRNGVFYDREGKDWDALVTRIVESPISVRQAFWSPYKKLVRLIEEQVNKRAAEAEAEANANVASKATTVDAATKGDVQKGAPQPKKLDIGVVAALGVAVGGITAALGVMLQAFTGLGVWMPLGVVALMLAISGPSMAVAALKLRRRNIGPLLDANGWAVNVLPRVNIPLGQSLTKLGRLPPGAGRDLVDPFAEKKPPIWRTVLLLLVIASGVAWYLGLVDRFVPDEYKSVTVLGEAAPARVEVKPVDSAPAAGSAAPAPANP